MTKAELIYALEPYVDEAPIYIKLYNSVWPRGNYLKPGYCTAVFDRKGKASFCLAVHNHNKAIGIYEEKDKQRERRIIGSC